MQLQTMAVPHLNATRWVSNDNIKPRDGEHLTDDLIIMVLLVTCRNIAIMCPNKSTVYSHTWFISHSVHCILTGNLVLMSKMLLCSQLLFTLKTFKKRSGRVRMRRGMLSAHKDFVHGSKGFVLHPVGRAAWSILGYHRITSVCTKWLRRRSLQGF